jgi:hypothetical protein
MSKKGSQTESSTVTAPVTAPTVPPERVDQIMKSLDAEKPSGGKILDAVLSSMFSRKRAIIGPQAKAYVIESVAKNCGKAEFQWLAREIAAREPTARSIVFMVAKKYRIDIEGGNDHSASHPSD